ncbi:MAG: 4-hydroxy-3-methylbut-2-enyl diphosphate reductase [Armatimonadota bacterium]|nr:4-hydroxy-3-methylbut-2-enyl diphosphate reductase [Armatimonadota bacterium]
MICSRLALSSFNGREMKVKLANPAGFCYGVRRAIDVALEAAEKHGTPMYTLGPLIHNPQVILKLEERGIHEVHDIADAPQGSFIIMPSHGVPREVMRQAENRGLQVVDVTCPFVRKVHEIAENLVADGYQVIVLGDPGHTEVRGIMSVAGENGLAVSDVKDIDPSKLCERVGIISQTTQTTERFERLVEEVARWVKDVRAHNTICHATTRLQKAALDLAAEVDVMLVIGGHNSANTRRLAEICADTGVPTHHIEVASELEDSWFTGVQTVGVTAGASTPDWIIEEVVKKLENWD